MNWRKQKEITKNNIKQEITKYEQKIIAEIKADKKTIEKSGNILTS